MKTKTQGVVRPWSMLLLLWVALGGTSAQAGVISRVAGKEVAYLNDPRGIAVDASGTRYVADSQNNRVLKVTPDGTITTLASGLNWAAGIAVDAAGNVYVSELNGHDIRKIAAGTGNITTLATGLSSPMALAFDGAGNLYVADNNTDQISRVDQDGTVTPVAGTPRQDGGGPTASAGDGGPALSAGINQPMGLTFDLAGNMYIASWGCNCIRKVNANDSLISTVAGDQDPNGGYSGDGAAAVNAKLQGPHGVAVDTAGNLFIADTENHAIRKVDVATGNISTIAGGQGSANTGDGGPALAAGLIFPHALAIDGYGSVYIASANAVRKMTPGGGIATDVGFPTGFMPGPATMVPLQSTSDVLPIGGQLFIAARDYNTVFRVDQQGTLSLFAGDTANSGYDADGVPAIGALMSSPRSLAADAAGNLYIGDGNNALIRKVSAATGRISTIAGDVSDGAGNTGYTGDGGLATQARISGVNAMSFDAAGNLYFADADNSVIRKIAAGTGIISTVAGQARANAPAPIRQVAGSRVMRQDFALPKSGKTPANYGDGGLATAADLYGPFGMTVDAVGNIYIADTWHNRIRKVNAATGIITTIAGGNNGFAGDGTIGDGGLAINASFSSPQGLALDRLGNLFIADTGNNRVRKVDAVTGIVTTVAGTGVSGSSGDGGEAASATLQAPTAIRIDNNGILYIADQSAIVRKVDLSADYPPVNNGGNNGGNPGSGGGDSIPVPPPVVTLPADIPLPPGTSLTPVGSIASVFTGTPSGVSVSGGAITVDPAGFVPGSAPLVISASVANGVGIVLNAPSGTTPPKPVTLSIGGQNLVITSAAGGNTLLTTATVLVGGKPQQVLLVTSGSASLSASAPGQVVGAVSIPGSATPLLVTANDAGANVVISSTSSGTVINTNAGSTTIAIAGFANGFADGGTASLKLYAGEKVSLDQSGKVTSITLASSAGNGSAGDPLVLPADAPLQYNVAVPNLNAGVARLNGDKLQAVVAGAMGGTLTADQGASGVLSINTSSASFTLLPIGAITVNPARNDGVAMGHDGLLAVTRSGVTVKLAPSVTDPLQLAVDLNKAFSGATLRVDQRGVLLADVGSERFAVRPDAAASAASAAGFVDDKAGVSYANGQQQWLLHPAFVDTAALQALVAGAIEGATSTVNADGSLLVTTPSQTLTLRPDYGTRSLGADDIIQVLEGKKWWIGSDGALYFVFGERIQRATVQAVQ